VLQEKVQAMKKSILFIVSALVLIVLALTVNYFMFQVSSEQISTGKPILHKGPTRQAVLVIDIQEGITGQSSTDDFFRMNSGALIGVVNHIVDSSAGNNVPVIYVKNEITNPLINILNNSMAKGSPGAELDSRLRIASEYVVNKDKGDAFSNPLLDTILEGNDINKLVFVGLDLAQCVKNTIMAAANRKYEICLISDALITKPSSQKDSVLEIFKQNGFEIMTSKEYIERLH
jgi:nicotinamidase/pyrazinamidase